MERKKGHLIPSYYLSLYWAVQRAIPAFPSETWGLGLQDRRGKVRETAQISILCSGSKVRQEVTSPGFKVTLSPQKQAKRTIRKKDIQKT